MSKKKEELDKVIEKIKEKKERVFKKYKSETNPKTKGELAKEFCGLNTKLSKFKRKKRIRERNKRELGNRYKDLILELLNVGDEKAIVRKFIMCLYIEYKRTIDSGYAYNSQVIKELDKYIEKAHELEREICRED